jgi:hypothetical protein
MFSSRRRIRAAAVLFSLAALPSPADTVSLVPVADTALWQENDTNNLGGELSLPAGGNSSANISRALFRFDLASIPPSAIITNVTLRLYVTNAPTKTNPVNSTFVLHRVLRDWGEGNKKSPDVGRNGAQATTGEATWNARFYPATLWSSPGAAAPVDYSSTQAGTNFVTGLGSYLFGSSSNLVADVQSWVANPATNFGWMLRSLAEATAFSNRRFASREDSLNPPLLTVMFTLSTAPLKIDRVQWVPPSFSLSFAATPGQTYNVEYSDTLAVGSWNTLTNLLAAPGVTNLSVSDASGQPRRFYRLRSP